MQESNREKFIYESKIERNVRILENIRIEKEKIYNLNRSTE